MTDPFVVEVVRGGIVESTHLVDAAIVDDAGRVTFGAGDPLTHAAFRSSAKPLQAGVMLENGWDPARTEHLAIACASHNGEPEHVRWVDGVLASAGLDREALLCPAALPNAALPELVARAGEPARAYHNCSGKHAAMLATCVVRGWPLETYREPQHPLQQQVHDTIEHLAGTLLESATDGCGVVTFAAPLAALARAFGAVLVGDEPFARAARAMREHPFLVAGTDRLDTAVMSAVPSLTVKGGAEGLACAAGDGFALAMKVRDGAARATGPVLVELLARTGALSDDARSILAGHETPVVLGGGRPVGHIRLRR